MKSLLSPRAVLTALLLASCLATAAHAGQNPMVSLPLHAKASSFEPCNGYLPVDCRSNHPVVNINPGPAAIFLFVMNYNAVAGVQTAFLPDPSWTFTFGLWDCQPGQLNAVTPAPPFGATAGTITTAFNCLTGPDLGVIGRMFFVAGAVGCIQQVQSSYPFGIHVLDCQQGIDQITENQAYRLGKICVGQGGYDTCDPHPAVEPATWGGIKAQYQ
jgi:hypothetical protein